MWYCASIVLRSEVKHGRADKVDFEERFVLLQGYDLVEAKEAALMLGKRMAHSYENIGGESVQWEFVRVGRICEIVDDDLAPGTEVFFRTVGREEAEGPGGDQPEDR